MSWEDILKEEENSRYFSEEMIKIEKILDEIVKTMADYKDLLDEANKFGNFTEQMGNKRQNMKKGIIDQLEEMLEEFKGKLT